MPMSTPRKEDNDDVQSPNESVVNKTNIDVNNKNGNPWIYLTKEVSKYDIFNLKKDNLGDTFPVVTCE